MATTKLAHSTTARQMLPPLAGDDTALLAAVDRFWDLQRECCRLRDRRRALAEAIEADLDCPPRAFPSEDRTAYERHEAFRASRGLDDASYDEWYAACRLRGNAAQAIFRTRSRTVAGLAAKLRILAAARGRNAGRDDGDIDLDGFDRNWFDLILADAERLAGATSPPAVPAIAAE